MSLGPMFLPGLLIVARDRAGPRRLQRRFVAAWGTTERSLSHRVGYDLLQVNVWGYRTEWHLRLETTCRAMYGIRLEARATMPYRDRRITRLTHRVVYASTRPIAIRHAARYADLPLLHGVWRSHYDLTQAHRAQFNPMYALTDTDPVRARLRAPWAVLADQRLQPVANAPELTWKDRRVRIVSARLSCDEDSPYWLSRVEVAHLADFALITIGDRITLDLGAERFVFVVDGKALSRVSMAEQHAELSGISPLALLDAPFASAGAFARLEALPARVAVEQLLGPVDWQLPAWTIPAGRLLMENVTPLAAARRIVEAIGGLIESRADGGVICRLRYPISLPRYTDAAADHTLDDSDVITAECQAAPHQGFNRVTIANDSSAGLIGADRVEYIANPDNRYRGLVRAYLGYDRPVRLAHTGHPSTLIQARALVVREERETVEFIEGGGATRYPVTALAKLQWRHDDLGAVSFAGAALRSTSPGYSLLDITYTVTAIEWTVALPADEDVQFVLIDQ